MGLAQERNLTTVQEDFEYDDSSQRHVHITFLLLQSKTSDHLHAGRTFYCAISKTTVVWLLPDNRQATLIDAVCGGRHFFKGFYEQLL